MNEQIAKSTRTIATIPARLRLITLPSLPKISLSLTQTRILDIAEVTIIILWALWLTKPYADFNPEIWPRGSDFARNIQLFSTWQNLPVCGDCVLWNGTINGGAPAFADMFTPVLNPLVIITTMIWDVITAAKVMLIVSFIIAGLAQLWLGRVLGISRLARIWTAAMIVAGGHLSARMEMGHIVMVIPIAAASLMLPAALDVARTGRRRSVVLLALTMAYLLVSGHGYIQIAVLLGFLPALLVYCFDSRLKLRSVWRSFAWAAGLTILVTAIFWIPLMHFWPNIQKDGNPAFNGGQPILYALLNLVIGDRKYLVTEILGKPPFPAMYSMYIGWIPVVLAIFGLALAPRRETRTKIALALSIFLIYFVSSGTPYKWLADTPFAAFFSMGRYMSLLQPLAIPMIMALAGWGLDGLARWRWPRLSLSIGAVSPGLNLVVLLFIPALLGLNSAQTFSADWILTEPVPYDDFPMSDLSTSYARWVAMPFDQFRSFPRAIDAHLKMIIYRDYTAWNWLGRQTPPPAVELTFDSTFRSDPTYTHDLGPMVMLEHPDRPYAYVQSAAQEIKPCKAVATGGRIDVTCKASQAGTLTVSETNYSGWHATVNDREVPIHGNMIEVAVPSGDSVIKLRYQPLDVKAGGIISLIGLILCAVVWWKPMSGLPEAVPLEDLDQPEPETQA